MFAKWDFVRLERIQLGKEVYYRVYPSRVREGDHTDVIHMLSSDHSERPDRLCNKQELKQKI